jgi:nonsense-mediated mRNA decay protein 3
VAIGLRVCPRCGRETPVTIRGLCPRCFAEVYGVARLPGEVRVDVCRYCGSVKLSGRWLETDATFEGVVDTVVRWLSGRLQPVEPLASVEVLGWDAITRPNWSTRILLRLRGRTSEGVEVEAEAPIVVRLNPSICPRCKTRVSGEYSILVQIRGKRRLKRLVEEAIEKAGIVSDVIEVSETKDGVNAYLTHRGAASRLITALKHLAPLRVSGPYREYVGVTSRGKRRTRDTYVIRIE